MRLIVRRTAIAWAIFAIAFVGFAFLSVRSVMPTTVNPWLLLALDAAVLNLLAVWALWRYGALAFAVCGLVASLPLGIPLTPDLSRWYAWRGPCVVAVIAAVVLWGFKNVLGKQTAFPSGALDG